MTAQAHSELAARPAPPLWRSLIRLARPTQWSKSVFVLVGPFYGARDLMAAGRTMEGIIIPALLAAAAFAMVSSGCYVINDIFDRVADRSHPRKARRPIAAGYISVPQAWTFAIVLFALAAAFTTSIAFAFPDGGGSALKVGAMLGLYAVNVFCYSARLKHHIIADVISLALGFVIRVLAGCFAIGIEPTVWLLNVTFFLSMFLAFGKRLGERRTLDGRDTPPTPAASSASPAVVSLETGSPRAVSGAALHRRVQARYTDTLLQIAVVVCAAITLMTYALYVQDQSQKLHVGYKLWLTVLPLTYGLFRCIVLLEEGEYDDPTEIAVHDRGMQFAAVLFLAVTIALVVLHRGAPSPATPPPGDPPVQAVTLPAGA
ncbi:MAG TPA: UbiA prenyltransferase family protein [Phycisphaerales bacterium]|nr:UbiA prenyltransferase family protein [Phycisphaerales bacterium]